MTEIRRGVYDPKGKPLTLGDLEGVAKAAITKGYSRDCPVELETPLAGNRRAVKISVIEEDFDAVAAGTATEEGKHHQYG